jgi:hypothetical protein
MVGMFGCTSMWIRKMERALGLSLFGQKRLSRWRYLCLDVWNDSDLHNFLV